MSGDWVTGYYAWVPLQTKLTFSVPRVGASQPSRGTTIFRPIFPLLKSDAAHVVPYNYNSTLHAPISKPM